MGLAEDKIITSDADQYTATKQLLEAMLSEDSEILTIIVGEDANQQTTDQLVEWIESTYPDVEIENIMVNNLFISIYLLLNKHI